MVAATAIAFYVRLSQSPQYTLEVTGDFGLEESLDGMSVNDLGAGLTGCDGGIDE
jgi:hypothetical protein